jgi:hypothetical protein
MIPGWFSSQPQLVDQFNKLLQSELSLGSLCDVLSFALPLEAESKQQLLEELDVSRRIEQLLESMKTYVPPPSPIQAGRAFPPDFSTN